MTSNADATCSECGAQEPYWNASRADPDNLRAEIERLTAENEAIRKDRDDLLQQALGVEAERDIARMENERLRAAGSALIADVRRRYPGEELRCQYMRALDDAIVQQLTPETKP